MTYGFIELPPQLDKLVDEIHSKSTQKLQVNFKDAWGKAGTFVKDSIKNPTQTLNNLGKFLNDQNVQAVGSTISNTVNTVTSKYSGIAIAQLLIDGKITCKSAADYLFLGVAPALNQVGVALGYTSLNQMARALFDGSINVGQFVSGLSNACTSIYNIAKDNNIIEEQNKNRRIYFDMTLSDSVNYQSETPDRRVEKGNDLTEFCHNLPPTFDVQAELQDGKRYSKEEFRTLLTTLRDKRVLVTLYLGDEHFDSLILQSFNPSGQGSQKGGYEYSLQFKQIDVGQVEEIVITAFAKAPSSNVSAGTQAIAGNKQVKSGVSVPNTGKGKTINNKQEKPNAEQMARSLIKQGVEQGKWKVLNTYNAFSSNY